ncbi:type II toxin-antitoxin system PemK/MazF family toxin [Micromonospora terminaliae]|uniref:Type II toxin-antitoxin system PemK/MazF family toxin n=1 Tax=Micromonospora terminaliae TaxID=1914461 RepID=A0AAJ3DJ87_9ACTN|nr:type II toxin-antitoxin system PemK/MazF family toxin [Micromonospora terminaliae]NES28622.1 type II toxin-antitoxin system PemK/MazF family toxin [Micromonospora terminaliae]QGL45657.1 type II toxin-antitoxin system PemK/MazF family toxin [Micromonospora terminaliae]
MRDGLLWAAVIVACVAAGWLWGEWRRRAADRSAEAGRSAGRQDGRTGAPPRPRDAARAPASAPRPGEIWWADVPYADGTGSKVRPCLVLRVDGRDADVLKITSQDKSNRDDHLPIPTRSWDPDADHDSYLDISEPIPVPLAAFEDRAGACDPDLWRGIRRLPHLTA